MIQKEAKVVLRLQLVLFGQTPLECQSIFTVSVAVCQTVGFILDTSIFPSTGSALWTLFFFAVGVKILDVFPAVSLSLYSFLIHVVRRLQRPELCLHWHNSGLLLLGALNCTQTVSSC